MRRIKNLIPTILLLAIVIGCSSTKVVQSNKSDNVKIDGLQTEWEGRLTFDEKYNIAVGFVNDKENLYICLVTNDRSNIMKIMRMGLTIWLSPENGKKIGIRFPIVDQENMPVMLPGQSPADFERGDINARFVGFASSQKEIQIVNKDNYPLYLLNINAEQSFNAKLGFNNGNFVYELKVPLKTNKSAKYFIETSPSEKLLVDIETNEFRINSSEMGSGGGAGRGSGGRQPGGGSSRRPGGMPGSERGTGLNMDKIEVAFEVMLSK